MQLLSRFRWLTGAILFVGVWVACTWAVLTYQDRRIECLERRVHDQDQMIDVLGGIVR